MKFKLPLKGSSLYFTAYFPSLGHTVTQCYSWSCQILTPLKKAKFKKKKKKSEVLKNTAENEAGEGKQTARESNLSQGSPQRSKTN